MPVARYQLPDGRIARFEVPEGTTPEQAQQIGVDYFASQQVSPQPAANEEPQQADTSGASRYQKRVAGREANAANNSQSMYEGLPDETRQQIIDSTARDGRGSGAVGAIRKRLATLEQLRQVNPYLAEEIENMDGIDAALIGAGGSFQNVMDGLERVFTEKTGEDFKKPHLDALKNIRSSAELGDLLGQASLFAAPGGVTGKIASTLPRVGANAALGAIEGGLVSGGRGDDGADIAINAAIGGAIGSAAPEAVKVVADTVKRGGVRAMDIFKSRVNQAADTPTPQASNILEGPESSILRDAPEATIAQRAQRGPAPASTKMQEIKDKIARGIADKDTAGYKIDNAGRLRKDPIEQQVLSQGWDDGVTPLIKASSPVDRQKMKAMIDIYQRGTQNALEKAKNRPAKVLGQSIMDRYRAVQNINKDARMQLEGVAKSLQGKKVDFDPAVTNFKNNLESQGITVRDDWSLDFTDSTIEFSNRSKTFLNNIIKKMSRGGGGVDAYRGHQVKRMIDTMVDYGKKNQQSADSITEGIVKNLRHDIDGVLDSNFPKYDKVNTQLRDTISAMDEFAKQAGTKFKPDQANVDDFTGVLARTFMSNNRGRPALYTALESLEGIASGYGKKFDDNILSQVVFVEEMERMLGPSASTSLFGDVLKAGNLANPASASTAIDIGLAAAKKLKGKTPENAIKKMQEYLASFKEAS